MRWSFGLVAIVRILAECRITLIASAVATSNFLKSIGKTISTNAAAASRFLKSVGKVVSASAMATASIGTGLSTLIASLESFLHGNIIITGNNVFIRHINIFGRTQTKPKWIVKISINPFKVHGVIIKGPGI
jgi:hypothetical protein